MYIWVHMGKSFVGRTFTVTLKAPADLQVPCRDLPGYQPDLPQVAVRPRQVQTASRKCHHHGKQAGRYLCHLGRDLWCPDQVLKGALPAPQLK